MTFPPNPSFNSRDDDRDDERSPQQMYVPETMFVASMLHTLRERSSQSAQTLASELVELGPITSQDFSKVVAGMNHRETILEVLGSVHSLFRPDTRFDVVEIVPTLIALSEKLVLGERDVDEDTADRLIECFAHVVSVLEGDQAVCLKAREEVGSSDLSALRRIAQKGPADRDGYWTSVVLQCVLDPSPESLFHLDLAVAQLEHDRTPDDLILVSVRRAVSAIAASHFSDVVEWLGGHLESERNKWAMAEATLGLCEQASTHHGELIRFIVEGGRPEQLVACTACMFLGQDKRFGLSPTSQRELASVLRALTTRLHVNVPAEYLTQTATRALLHLSKSDDDVRRVNRYFLNLLDRGCLPTAELAFSYATALSKIREAEPYRPVIPHSTRSTQASSSELLPPQIAQYLSENEKEVRKALVDIEGFVEDLLDKSKAEIIDACEDFRRVVRLSDLTPRSEEASDIFVDPKQALRFVRRYNFILDQSFFDVAALLLPEVISAVECAVLAPHNRLKGKLMFAAVEGLEQVSYNLAPRPELQELAQRRLSDGDREVLTGLPARTLEGDYNVPLELAIASLGVRTALGSSQGWQDELLKLWRECPRRVKENTDPSALPFFSVIAERRFPGSAWAVITRASLWRDEPGFFRDMSYGLLGDSTYPERICQLVGSEKGEEISKAFALAQAMQGQFTDAQREEILSVARSLLGEFGVLGLDAIVTVSSLSRSLDDVKLLMTLPAAVGTDEAVHSVTCFDGISRILRNARDKTSP
jgi:hypothetical protein